MRKKEAGNTKNVVLSFRNTVDIGKKIARRLKCMHSTVRANHFPDQDSYVRLMIPVSGCDVILVQTLHPAPNDSLLELLFAANVCREQHARCITFVIPYLAYMRQDKAFHDGECITSRVMAKLLSSSCDRLITLDPHLHRYHSLNDVFTVPSVKITAVPILANYVKKNVPSPLILGPDAESNQWSEAVAKQIGTTGVVLKKKRYTSRSVRIHLSIDVRNRNVVIVDDIISTGHTMLETVKQLRKKGAKRIICLATHGVLAEGALQKLQRTGAEVVTTNTINNPVAKIDVSEEIVEEIKRNN